MLILNYLDYDPFTILGARKGANSKVRCRVIFMCDLTNMESSNYKMGSMFNFKKISGENFKTLLYWNTKLQCSCSLYITN